MLVLSQGLYLGSLGAANNRNALKSLNITHVLTVATLVSLDYHSDFIHKTIEGGSIYLSIPSLLHIGFKGFAITYSIFSELTQCVIL